MLKKISVLESAISKKEEEKEEGKEVDKKNSVENKFIHVENSALKEQIASLEAKVANKVKMILHLNNGQAASKKKIHD